MSILKAKIEQDLVLGFLKENFDDSVSEICFLTGGEMSQAFSFHSKGEDFVIRINIVDKSFIKDDYSAKHFGSETIPIPKVLKIGKFNDQYFYAISQLAKGKTVNFLTTEEYQKVLPGMLLILDSIQNINVDNTIGYGNLDGEGVGKYDSWKDFVLDVDFHVKQNEYFENTFFEKDVWDKLYKEMQKLLPYCLDKKYLIHGGYSSGNILSDGENITGIIDWDSSLYGDFVFDIAWLSFWTDRQDAQKVAENYYRKKSIPNFEERLLCYKLRIGLGSLSFSTYLRQEEKYNIIKERTLLLLNQSI